MEDNTSCDPNLLLDVLAQGEQQIKQLEALLTDPTRTEFCKSLAQQIRSNFKKATSMAKLIDTKASPHPPYPNNTSSESPRSASGSPHSESSERAFKEQERREMCKKRKTLPKWTSQVRVSSGAGIEAPLDDGYSWRKYGQKDILGAKHPRGYYRCTHRHTHGCPATKQVQRSDEDPSIFDITYRGAHTCFSSPRPVQTPAAAHQEPDVQQTQQDSLDHHNQQHPQYDQQLLLSFRTGLKVKTEDLDLADKDHTSPNSFSFPPTPASNLTTPENHMFSSPPTLENNFMRTFSPAFISPATSESNYYSVPPCHMMSSFGGGQDLHASESDLNDIISAATSAANSSMADIDFMLEPVEFNSNFPFDASNLFH